MGFSTFGILLQKAKGGRWKTEKRNLKILRFPRPTNRNGGMRKTERINPRNILIAERTIAGEIKYRNE